MLCYIVLWYRRHAGRGCPPGLRGALMCILHMYRYTYVQICICVYIYIYMWYTVCIYTYMCIYMCIYIYICIHIHMYMYIYIYIYIYYMYIYTHICGDLAIISPAIISDKPSSLLKKSPVELCYYYHYYYHYYIYTIIIIVFTLWKINPCRRCEIQGCLLMFNDLLKL